MTDHVVRFGRINRTRESAVRNFFAALFHLSPTSVQAGIASGSLMISMLTMHEALQHRGAANRRKVRL